MVGEQLQMRGLAGWLHRLHGDFDIAQVIEVLLLHTLVQGLLARRETETGVESKAGFQIADADR